jgi:arabinofuranosyltransferase
VRVPASWRQRGPALLGAALALSLFAAAIAGFHDRRHDDAFITYRYGENIARGRGFVFNPGERLMGSTSPGQALLAALGHASLGHDRLPDAMNVLGIGAWLAQAALFMRLLAPALGRLGAGVVAAGLAAGAAQSWAWISLETNLAFALALGAVVQGLAGRWAFAAVLAALAGLARPDAFLAAALLAPLAWAAGASRAWRAALVFLGLALPWPVFAWFYFGSPLPMTARIKFRQSGLVEYAGHALSHPALTLFDSAAPAVVVATWALALGGAVALVRVRRSLLVLPAWAIAHVGAYLYLRPTLLHTWHLYPAVALVAVFVLALPAALIRSRSGPVRVGASVVCLLLVGLWTARLVEAARRYPEEYWTARRHAVYDAVAAYLRKHALPGERVAALEVGTIAYQADVPMHDGAGLTSLQPKSMPADVRWSLYVTHQLRGWREPGWQAPARLVVPGHSPKAAFGSGRFRAWLYRVGPDPVESER